MIYRIAMVLKARPNGPSEERDVEVPGELQNDWSWREKERFFEDQGFIPPGYFLVSIGKGSPK